MTKAQIIEGLYLDRQFKKVCQNIAPPSLSDDLFHETIVVFLEMDDEKVIKASQEGYLKWLFIKIASNSFNSKTSPFYHKYHHNDDRIEVSESKVKDADFISQGFEIKFKELVESIEKQIECLDFYERELLKLYIKFGNYRDVSREVGIKYESVRHAIRLAINKIKQNNDKLYNDMLN